MARAFLWLLRCLKSAHCREIQKHSHKQPKNLHQKRREKGMLNQFSPSTKLTKGGEDQNEEQQTTSHSTAPQNPRTYSGILEPPPTTRMLPLTPLFSKRLRFTRTVRLLPNIILFALPTVGRESWSCPGLRYGPALPPSLREHQPSSGDQGRS